MTAGRHPGQVGSCLLQSHKRKTTGLQTLSPKDNLELPIRPQEQKNQSHKVIAVSHCCANHQNHRVWFSPNDSAAHFLSLQISILSCSCASLTGDKIPVFFIRPVSPLHQMLPAVLIKEVHSKCLQTEGGSKTKKPSQSI